jgi:large exoprotein involved in heme utilization and adhesion
LFTGVSTFAGNPFPGEPAGDVPDIVVEGGDILIANAAGLVSQRFGPGEAGDVTIKGDTVTATNGSMIVNLNTYDGAGGNIIVDASQLIIGSEEVPSPFPGFNVVTTSSKFSPVFGNPTLDPDYVPGENPGDPPIVPPNNFLIYAPELASADAGNITINVAGEVQVYGGDIMTESQSYGKAGDITMTASDIQLSREGGAFGQIATQSGYSGDAGHIDINATGDIQLKDGYVVSASTAGTGTGGDVSLTAGNNITIDGIHQGPGSSGIGSSTISPPAQVETQLANLYGFPDLQTMAAVFTGNPAASLFDVLGVLKAMGLTDLDGANPVAGNAGAISVAASTLMMNGNHVISSSTSSDGNGGVINIDVDSLSMANGAEIRSRSGLISEDTGELLVGFGNGGDINIVATDHVTMENDSSISSSSLGDGLAGNIFVGAGNTLDMRDSSISTQATVSDGGNIEIQAEKMVYLENSEITTSVESGFGAGGNIDIDPDFVILQSSNILANAYGGPGGNITIVAGNFIATPDSSVDASSELGIDGTVSISSPEDNVAEDLTVLPKNYLDVTSLISGRCDTSAGSSSLVDAGPGGQVIDPDGYLPGFAVAMDIEGQQSDETAGQTAAKTADSKSDLWWSAYVRKQGLQLAGATCNF